MVKEIILDRSCEQQVKRAALPGLKKMHHRVYSYNAANIFTELALFENSFSSGKGKVFSSAKLEHFMASSKFQIAPNTITILGANNPSSSYAVNSKDLKEAKLEQLRDQAALVKQLKHESVFKVVEASGTIFPCDTPSCSRIFGSEKRLRLHKMSQVCGLSKQIFRKYRGTKIITKGNNIKDCAVEMVMKDGFASVATVVSQNTTPLQLPLLKNAKIHNLCDGDKVVRAPLTEGFARTKRWSSRTRYSQRQLGFLKWAFNLGAKDESKKLTAEKARS